MQPDGRTLQARCEVSGAVGRGSCQTPRERTVRGYGNEEAQGAQEAQGARERDARGEPGEHGGYTAVSEIASADGKLLLRSGSNSPEHAGD